MSDTPIASATPMTCPGPELNGPVSAVDYRLEVGGVIKESLLILFGNFFPFMSLAILVSVPGLLLQRYGPGFIAPEYTSFLVLGIFLLNMLLGYLLVGMLVYGTFLDMKGERASFGAIVGKGLTLLFSVVAVSFVTQLLSVLGTIALIIPGIILYAMFYVAVPVSVVERTPLVQSLKRSKELTNGNRWRILGLTLLMSIIAMVLAFIPAFVIGFSAAAFGSNLGLFGTFGELIANAIAIALFSIAVAVTYHKLRTGREGLDARQLAAVFD